MGPILDLVLKAATGLQVDVQPETFKTYRKFLKKLARRSVIVIFLLLPLPIIGSIMHISLLNGIYLAIIGLLTTIWLVATLPIIGFIQSAYKDVNLKKIKRTAKTIGGVLFWILLLAIYFYLVPVWNYPAAIPLVFIICAILALGFMRFGIGINPKIVIGMVLIILCFITISFYMPASRSAMNKSVGWLDRGVAEFILTPERRVEEEQKRRDGAMKLEEQRRIQSHEDFLNRYLSNRTFVNRSESSEIAILVIDEGKKISYDIAQKIAGVLKTKGLNATSSLFTGYFVSDGLFNKIFEGDAVEVKNLGLTRYSDYIILGKKAVSFTGNPEMQNMITARAIIEVHIISARKGTIEDSFTISQVGAGFSKSTAEELAIKRILENLAEKDWNVIRKKEV